MNTLVIALRERLGLSQRELASLLEVHPMTVSKWECGRAFPNKHHAALLQAWSL